MKTFTILIDHRTLGNKEYVWTFESVEKLSIELKLKNNGDKHYGRFECISNIGSGGNTYNRVFSIIHNGVKKRIFFGHNCGPWNYVLTKVSLDKIDIEYLKLPIIR